MSGSTQPDDPVKVPTSWALDPEVFDAVFAAVDPTAQAGPVPSARLPSLASSRPDLPLGAVLIRLVTGCSRVDVKRLLHGAVSDPTLRARRDEGIAGPVFNRLLAAMLVAYDADVGVELAEVCVDDSLHEAP